MTPRVVVSSVNEDISIKEFQNDKNIIIFLEFLLFQKIVKG